MPRFTHCLIAAALATLSLSFPAIAYTGLTVEKTCPYDGTKFSANLEGTGTSVDIG